MDYFVVPGIGPGCEVAAAWKTQLLTTAFGTCIAITKRLGKFRALFTENGRVMKMGTFLPFSVLKDGVLEGHPFVPRAGYKYTTVIPVQAIVLYTSFWYAPKIGHEPVFGLEEPYHPDNEHQ